MSRDTAHYLRKKFVEKKGNKIVDRKLIKEIKEYCRDEFGSASYWSWLALYTELRGEFKHGWIPYDYYRFQLLPKMNPEKFMRLSEAKTIDHKLFKGSVVDPLFTRLNGQYYNKEGVFIMNSALEQKMRELDTEIIIKPDDGRKGKRIIFKYSKELKLEELPLDSDLVIQKVVKQHSILNKLYPHSINTFRVLTNIDHKGSVQIKYIVLRFGRNGSRVDNISSGGGWVIVHLNGKTGGIGFEENGNIIGEKHPDTAIKYSELKFPFFEKIVNLCKNLHGSFPYVKIVGWDVFVDEDGNPKLIEWNANNPAFWQYEAYYGPFWNEIPR